MHSHKKAASPFFPPIPQVSRVCGTMQRRPEGGGRACSTAADLPLWLRWMSAFAKLAFVDLRAVF